MAPPRGVCWPLLAELSADRALLVWAPGEARQDPLCCGAQGSHPAALACSGADHAASQPTGSLLCCASRRGSERRKSDSPTRVPEPCLPHCWLPLSIHSPPLLPNIPEFCLRIHVGLGHWLRPGLREQSSRPGRASPGIVRDRHVSELPGQSPSHPLLVSAACGAPAAARILRSPWKPLRLNQLCADRAGSPHKRCLVAS